MLEGLIGLPSGVILQTQLILLIWDLFNFDLLLQIIHGISQLKVVSYMRHF